MDGILMEICFFDQLIFKINYELFLFKFIPVRELL